VASFRLAKAVLYAIKDFIPRGRLGGRRAMDGHPLFQDPVLPLV
jgi:hypothetical protein